MRKLASIQRVWDVQPIEGSDFLEQLKIEGWTVVGNKGDFKKGDLCVYFEIDSFLPVRPEFEFLRKTSYKNTDIMGEGFKLRTIKLRGVLSQGLALPISTFKELPTDIELGTDVTEFAEAFAGLRYYISTKMDGSSHSLSWDENGFHVCGHNYEYKDDGSSSFFEFIKQREYKESMKSAMEVLKYKTLTVQGEFCAPGIQKNPLRLTKPEWYVFTVRADGKRVGLETMEIVCQLIGAPTVPIEEIDTDLPSKYPTVEALLERADGNYSTGGRKEGIVIRTVEPVYNETISGPLSMKVVSNKYLLKQGE